VDWVCAIDAFLDIGCSIHFGSDQRLPRGTNYQLTPLFSGRFAAVARPA
jgi:hypothetical protein